MLFYIVLCHQVQFLYTVLLQAHEREQAAQEFHARMMESLNYIAKILTRTVLGEEGARTEGGRREKGGVGCSYICTWLLVVIYHLEVMFFFVKICKLDTFQYLPIYLYEPILCSSWSHLSKSLQQSTVRQTA